MPRKINPNGRRAPNVQVPNDLYDSMREFCEKHPGTTMADILRAGLNRYLPKLMDGEMLLANGKLVSLEELQHA